MTVVADATMIGVPVYRDTRGWLMKLLMNSQLPDSSSFGEIYAVLARPGQERGGHFHRLTNEWFFVLAGRARLHLRDGGGGSTSFLLDAEDPKGIFVPSGIWHQLENVNDVDAVILAFADKEYDSNDPDTTSEQPGASDLKAGASS